MLASAPDGLSMSEMRAMLECQHSYLISLVCRRLRMGLMVYVGAPCRRRYFATRDAADAYESRLAATRSQPPLEPKPQRKRGDPLAGETAAAEQRRAILEYVRAHPACVASRVGAATGVAHRRASERLVELREAGLIWALKQGDHKTFLWFGSESELAAWRAEHQQRYTAHQKPLPAPKKHGHAPWKAEDAAVVPAGVCVQVAPYQSNYRCEVTSDVCGEFESEWRALRHNAGASR